MSAADMFSVYLHGLPARDIDFKVLDDGRHWLNITRDIALVVKPGDDDPAAASAGLRKLAATATEMAAALDGIPRGDR